MVSIIQQYTSAYVLTLCLVIDTTWLHTDSLYNIYDPTHSPLCVTIMNSNLAFLYHLQLYLIETTVLILESIGTWAVQEPTSSVCPGCNLAVLVERIIVITEHDTIPHIMSIEGG